MFARLQGRRFVEYGPENPGPSSRGKGTAREAGITLLLDHLLTFSATTFCNGFDDIQIDVVADPLNMSMVAPCNAVKANIKGIELNSTRQPSPDFTLRSAARCRS